MASNTISILLQAQDNASKVIRDVGDNIEGAGKKSKESAEKLKLSNGELASMAVVSVGAGVAVHSLAGIISDSIGSANDYQNAMAGLSSIAEHFHVNADSATSAAQRLSKDGLMTVSDAARGLKNLLASGFSLDQAITLMDRFKDSAAFNRQAALGFGEAISSATEGIKNGNSILVDNAGVTKNLSVILTEAGYSAQDLMKATTDAGVRQALFNGILKETTPMMGDADKLAHQFAGSQAKLAAQSQVTAQKFGQAMQPALLGVMNVVTPLIMKFGDWTQKNPHLTSTLVIITGSLLALTAGLGIAVTSVGIFSSAFSGAMKVVQLGLLLVSLNPLVAGIIAGTLAIAALGAAFGLFAGQSDATGSAIQRHAQAQRDLTQAQKDAANATKELDDANLNLEGAQLRVEGAQARVAQALRDYGPTSVEYRQAIYDEKVSERDLEDQKRKVADATNAKVQANQKVIDQEAAVKQSSNSVTQQVNTERDAWIGLGEAAGKAREKAGGAKAGSVLGDQVRLPNGLRMPGFATGTSSAPGGRTLVGEMGPEIVNMPQGAQVVPAYRTRAASTGGGGASINIENLTIANQMDQQRFLSDLGWRLSLR
jgi:hypothetical protein